MPPVKGSFIQYHVPFARNGEVLSQETIYAAAAGRLNEARRLWIQDVRLGRKEATRPLRVKEQSAKRAKGRTTRPLVGSGVFLKKVEDWPIEVEIERERDGYLVSAWVEGDEAVKVLREGRVGEREMDLDLYDQLARSGGQDYADEALGFDAYA